MFLTGYMTSLPQYITTNHLKAILNCKPKKVLDDIVQHIAMAIGIEWKYYNGFWYVFVFIKDNQRFLLYFVNRLVALCYHGTQDTVKQ